jgi:P4 family phage/plasmid primase-like protien
MTSQITDTGNAPYREGDLEHVGGKFVERVRPPEEDEDEPPVHAHAPGGNGQVDPPSVVPLKPHPAPVPKQKNEAPAFSDIGLAHRFVEEHANRFRYVHTSRRWYYWDGTRWAYDSTQLCENLARETCDQAALGKHERVASRTKILSVVTLASQDRQFATTNDIWDAEDGLINMHHTTVKLPTGECYPPNPGDYITKKAGTIARDAGCPRWHEFLDRITAGDQELQAYLQRVAGYCLSGHTSEHVFFFSYGTGANGKSVFWNTLMNVMGEYACTSDVAAFTESRNDRHPTEFARLDGIRLVLVAETNANSRWNEGKIKSVTGGEPISARYMRGDFFEFVPRFKLSVMGNRKPSLRSVDEAMRRRLHLIPFTVTIPPEERDQALPDKLFKEWPGILQWAIDGAALWYAHGLETPTVVSYATDTYLEAEDTFKAWQEECVETTPELFDHFETSGNLFASWKAWAEENGYPPGPHKAFSQQLDAHQAVSIRRRIENKLHRGYLGFRLV